MLKYLFMSSKKTNRIPTYTDAIAAILMGVGIALVVYAIFEVMTAIWTT